MNILQINIWLHIRTKSLICNPYFHLQGEIKVNKVTNIKGYDEYGYEIMNFTLPNTDEATIHINELGRALANFGLSATDVVNSIKHINQALAQLDTIESVLNYNIDSKVNALKTEIDILKNNNLHNEKRIYEIERELYDLRSETSENTESSNQKSDLEIFGEIEWDEHFLNFGSSNIFLN